MRNFLTNACLLGAAILIWLTIIGIITSGIAVAWVLSDNNKTQNSTTFVDRFGNACGMEDTYINAQHDLVCP